MTPGTAHPDGGAFAPSRILTLSAQSLGGQEQPETCLNNAYEAIALVGHACMTAVDFRLVGLGEEGTIDQPSSTDSPQVLPKEWNASSTYAFRYAHAQSSMEYLLKIGRLGHNAVIYALAIGDDKTTTFDLPAKDYVSESSLPFSKTADTSTTSTALGNVFISSARLSDLIGLFKINVIQKLAPGLQKEGYEDSSQESRREEERQRRPEPPPQHDPLRDDRIPPPARPYPFDDPLAAAPRRPIPAGDFPPPGFEDEYEINRPPRGYPPGFVGGPPRGIGDRDRYPPGLGPHDPLRGTFGPGGGGGGGGMHPTLDDPLFGGGGGGGVYDPQAPPGARYDPVGPGDPRPFGRGHGPNFRGGSGGGRFGGSGGFGGGFGGDII